MPRRRDAHLKLSHSINGILPRICAVEVKPLSSLLKRPAWLGVFEASCRQSNANTANVDWCRVESNLYQLRTENGCDHVLKFELKKTTMLKVCEYLKHHRDHSVSEVITHCLAATCATVGYLAGIAAL